MAQPNVNAKVDVNITKVLIIAIAGIAGIGATWYILNRIKKGIKNIGENREQKDVPKAAGKSVVTSDLSYSNLWYEQSADRLMNAFEGVGTGTSTIKAIFTQLKTKSDVMQLISAFGTREGKSGMFGKFKGNLVSWLEEEEGNSIFKDINKILTNNKVEYAF